MNRFDPLRPRPDEFTMGFVGNRLIRDGENRTETSLAEALAAPGAKVYLSQEGAWLYRDGEERADPGFDVATALAHAAPESDCVLLGHTPGGEPRQIGRAHV